jgi:hypothetical protein
MKLFFFDEDSQDPDWNVCQCYMLLIASATEIVSGVGKLWKSGPSAGQHTYPDFGQYKPTNYFKAFCCAAPFCWSDECYWYEDTRDVPWDVFLPCPLKLGGLPNYTYEPRKPIPLGTMF